MGLEDALTIEDGARLYAEYCEEHKERSKPIIEFFVSYDIKSGGFHSRGTGHLSKYYNSFREIRKKGKLPKGITVFEEWIGLQIPERLKQRLEKLTGEYFREYSLEEGVESYIQHLQQNKERSKPIKKFFDSYNPEKRRILLRYEGHKKLRKYRRKFGELKDYGKLPRGITTFEDWVKAQIPKKLKQKLEELTEKYLPEYSVEEGAEFCIKYIEKHKEKSKSVKRFFMKYDIEDNGFHSGGTRHLNKYYRKFRELKDNGKLPRGITTFEEWVKAQIPKKLKQKLEELTEKYLREYSLEEGMESYIQHLQQYKEKSKPMKLFFMKYDAKNDRFYSEKGTGCLNRYYDKFNMLRKNGKLPKGVTAFEEWVGLQIPKRLKQKLEELTERYRPEYSVEEGVEFYMRYLKKHKEESKPIISFFMKYDVGNDGFASEKGIRHLNRYYNNFIGLKGSGKLPRGITTFEDLVKAQIPKKLKQKLEELTEKYLREYSLEEGVESYIQHLQQNKERSKPIKAFFENYNPKKKKILRGRGEGRKLRRYYKKFGELKNNGKLPEGVTQFEDYLISNLPEEKMERAEYYLKGGFLKDVAKAKIDTDKLKNVVLD